MALPKRNEVPVELTWDLTLIYKNDEEMLSELARMQSLAKEMITTYQGKLTTSQMINSCLDQYAEVIKILILVSHYAELATSVDFFDQHAMELSNKVNTVVSNMMASLSFIDSEIAECDEKTIEEAIQNTKDNKGYLKEVLRAKPYRLPAETEKVLAALSSTFNTPQTVYGAAKLADMSFDDFECEGKKYPLSYTLFEDNYNYESNTPLRRAAFDAFSKKLREYENVTAAAYNAQVTNEKIIADLRGYKDVFDYLLFSQKVTREMYDRQIDLITTKLAPHMRRYAKLIQKIYKLDKMTFADLKIPVDPSYDPKVTIDEAKDYCVKGLSIMGEDYVAMVKEAFENRWIDFAQNEGKSTGGFCASPYGRNSYILLSFNSRMSDVFTLAHELGHAGNFKACNEAQSVFDTEASMYFVEAPSTMNELIMSHYLLKTNPDKRFRRWVLSCMVSDTYFHNFVTHLLEADYQRKVYNIIQEGGSVSAPVLDALKRETLENFWGDAVEINEGAELTWMRQGHYYAGLYSYTYSAGLTVATKACLNIEKEGQAAVERWKEVLAAGGTLDPIGLAKLANIDITTDQPLLETIEYIGSMIDEIIQLTEELGELD